MANIAIDNAHILVAGTTGSGKSTLLHSIICSIMNGCDMYLVDPKRTELVKYKNCKSVWRYATTASETVSLLDSVIARMEERLKRMGRKGLSMSDEDHVFVIIDELADLMISPEAKEIKLRIQKITQLGRAARVHVIACTQSPSRKTLDAAMVLNFTCRIGLACADTIESRQIIGMSGCEFLPIPKPGDANQTRQMIVKYAGDRNAYKMDIPYTTPTYIAQKTQQQKRRFLGIF